MSFEDDSYSGKKDFEHVGGRRTAVYTGFNDPKAHDPEGEGWGMNPDERKQVGEHILTRYCIYRGEIILNTDSSRAEADRQNWDKDEDVLLEELSAPLIAPTEDPNSVSYRPIPDEEKTPFRTIKRGKTPERRREILGCHKMIALYRRELGVIIRLNNEATSRLGHTYDGPCANRVLLIQEAINTALGRVSTLKKYNSIESLRLVSSIIIQLLEEYRAEDALEKFQNYRNELGCLRAQLTPRNVSIIWRKLIGLLEDFIVYLSSLLDDLAPKKSIKNCRSQIQYDTYKSAVEITKVLLEKLQQLKNKIYGTEREITNIGMSIGSQRLHLSLLRHKNQPYHKYSGKGSDFRDGGRENDFHDEDSDSGDQVFNEEQNNTWKETGDTFYTLGKSGLLTGLSVGKGEKKKRK